MKKILNVLAIVVVVIFAGYNVYKAQKPVVMSDIAMANVEALAGCESPVESRKGRNVIMHCKNDDGSTYDLSGCDFDDAYITFCSGRRANDF